MAALFTRQNNNGNEECCDDFGNNCYPCSSVWGDWVRWVVLGVIIAVALLLFFAFSCVSARRRRQHGAQPYRGTAWTLGRTPPGHAPATYNTPQPYYNNSNNPAPPPAYTPAPNQGYYGGAHDVELQQPSPAYGVYSRNGDEPVYEPPKVPPPGRK